MMMHSALMRVVITPQFAIAPNLILAQQGHRRDGTWWLRAIRLSRRDSGCDCFQAIWCNRSIGEQTIVPFPVRSTWHHRQRFGLHHQTGAALWSLIGRQS